MSQTLNTVIALVKKDIVRFLSSPRSLLISLAAPIFIAAFFGSLFGGNDKKPSAIPIVVIDQDDTPVSRKIMDGLKAESGLDLRPLDAVEGEKAVRAGKVRAMLTLPKGFGQSATRALFGNGERPVIDIRYDPSQAMALAVVRGLLTQQVMQHVFGGLTGASGGCCRAGHGRSACLGATGGGAVPRAARRSQPDVRCHRQGAEAAARSACGRAIRRWQTGARRLHAQGPVRSERNCRAGEPGQGLQQLLAVFRPV